MAKHRQIDRQKEILRRQLYGKEVIIEETPSKNAPTYSFKTDGSTPVHTASKGEDFRYVKSDLTKILLLSSLAIGAQILLFLAIQNHMVKLPFFG